MSNPYASPMSADAEQPKKSRFGMLLFLIVFLLIFGGCAVSLLFVANVRTTVTPITVPTQPTVGDTPTELTAEQPTP